MEDVWVIFLILLTSEQHSSSSLILSRIKKSNKDVKFFMACATIFHHSVPVNGVAEQLMRSP